MIPEKPRHGVQYNECMDDEDDEDDDDEEEETWDEMDAESESHITCLFCTKNFKTMAVALEHCKSDHSFNLLNLKNKFQMDCYSYICMINYVRREGVGPQVISSCQEPPWLSSVYLAPCIPDDPWLMFGKCLICLSAILEQIKRNKKIKTLQTLEQIRASQLFFRF